MSLSISSALGARPRAPRHGPSLLLAVASLPVIAAFGACLIWLVVLSFFKPAVYGLYVPAFSFDNYARALTSPLYVRSLLLSLKLAAIATACVACLAYPMALYISRHTGARKGFYLACIIGVFLVTFVVKIYAWQILLERGGPIDWVARTVLGATEPVRLVGTETGVVIGLVYASLPYMLLALIASIEQVPRDLEAAADCFGASPLRVFFDVTLPLSMPGLVTGLLFAFAMNLAAFVAPALLGVGTVTMTGLLIQRVSIGAGSAGGNWPLAAALSVLLLLVCSVFTVLVIRLLTGRRWRLA